MDLNKALDLCVLNASLEVWVEAALQGFKHYLREIRKKRGNQLDKSDVLRYATKGIQAFRTQRKKKIKIEDDVLRWVIAWVFRKEELDVEKQRQKLVETINVIRAELQEADESQTLKRIKEEVINATRPEEG